MQLAAVFTVLVAAAVPGSLATVDLFCQCRESRHQDWMYAIHCAREQGGTSGISCQKALVPDVPRGYHYTPRYALLKLHRTYKPWAAAKQTCEAEGALLAIPRDDKDYNGLKDVFSKQDGIWDAYVGITDEAKEGVYMGADGRPASYLPWQPDEPSRGEEHCLIVDYDGLLNDVPCEDALPFFCERRLSTVVPDTYTWYENASRFYNVHKEHHVYEDAANVCRSENATLAIPDTVRRGLVLMSLLDPKYDGYLTGFTDEASEGDFVTETGRHLKDMEFVVWGSDEPNNKGDGKPENCLSLSAKGEYNDVRCDYDFPFICEIAPM